MKNKVIFYSSVKSKSLFLTQKFYQIDIDILQRMGYEVILSNKIVDAFQFWKYDVVFAYFFRYSFFFGLVARLFGKPVYLTGGIDALDIDYAGVKAYKIQKLFFRLCYMVATKCIIVSKTDLSHVEEIIGIKAKKLAFSEHTIDTKAFCNTDLADKEPNFCTIGWMGDIENVKRKGIDKAICLFSSIKKRPEFRFSKFYIMGKIGEGTNLLEEIIKELHLEDSVIITGEVSEQEKIQTLKNCMFYFQISHYKGFGIAALEALIAGCIVIHSGKGGLSNSIYKDHILVDINANFEYQTQFVCEKLLSIDMNVIQKNAKECLTYYDNMRRLKDFEAIIKSN